MCEKCRRLDPVNGAPTIVNLYELPQGRESRPYVAYTDRVLDFYNRVAAKVKAELPDKMLSMYAYSLYEAPPVKVRPDPCLIILTVAGGSYQTEANRRSARRSVAAWGTFGNKLLWRPNALSGYRAWAPHGRGNVEQVARPQKDSRGVQGARQKVLPQRLGLGLAQHISFYDRYLMK